MVVLLYAVCCIVWGSTWAVIRIGLADMPPFAYAASRMSVVAVLLMPWVIRHHALLDARALLKLWGIGVLQFGISFACIFAAATRVDSGLTAVLFGTYAIFVLIAARLWLPDEHLSRAHVAGIILGFVGLCVMQLGPTDHTFGMAAALPVLAAAVSSVAGVATKRLGLRFPPLLTLAGAAIVMAAILLAIRPARAR